MDNYYCMFIKGSNETLKEHSMSKTFLAEHFFTPANQKDISTSLGWIDSDSLDLKGSNGEGQLADYISLLISLNTSELLSLGFGINIQRQQAVHGYFMELV